MHVGFSIVVSMGSPLLCGPKDKYFRRGGVGEAKMLCIFYLEVGHVRSATFVISVSTINHVRGGVNAQWLSSAGGLSLWMPGPQPQCPNTVIPPLSFFCYPPEMVLLARPLLVPTPVLCFFTLGTFVQSQSHQSNGKVEAPQLFLTLEQLILLFSSLMFISNVYGPSTNMLLFPGVLNNLVLLACSFISQTDERCHINEIVLL